MNIMRISFLALTVLALVSVAAATQRLVPNPYVHIQDAIDDADSGDTVSVWGPIGVPPPYTYYENVSIHDKDVFLVNRSFLPNGGTGYDSSWDHVIIDGGHSLYYSVVSMTGCADAVLKGFTIQHGHTSGYGGGVYCNAGSVLKNHILNNYAATGGGSVFRE
jgi:hypothetical protein